MVLHVLIAVVAWAGTTMPPAVAEPVSPGDSAIARRISPTPDGLFAHQCDIPVFVLFHDNLSPEWQETYWKAFEYWNKALGREMFVNAGVTSESVIYESHVILVRHALPEEKEALPEPICAVTSYKTQVGVGCMGFQQIIVTDNCDGLGKSFDETVARHEIGHALGLRHNEDVPVDLMAPRLKNPGRPLKPSAEDVKTLREIYGS